MTQVVFRLLQKNEREHYKRIRLECLINYPEYSGDCYEEEINADPLKFDKVFFRDSDHSFIFGAFLDNKLIGICGFIQQKRIKTRHLGKLVQVYVDPLYRGEGIGRRMIQLTIKKAFENGEIEQILLGVIHINNRALCLYKELGFYEYGFIENYFKLNNISWSQILMVLTRAQYSTMSKLNERSMPPNPFEKFI
jgi:ribosomal protein S18 acetylase RimI-like enzyme